MAARTFVTGFAVGVTVVIERVIAPIGRAGVTVGALSGPVACDGVTRSAVGYIQVGEGPTDGGVAH